MSYVCDNNGESTDVKRKVVVGGGVCERTTISWKVDFQ